MYVSSGFKHIASTALSIPKAVGVIINAPHYFIIVVTTLGIRVKMLKSLRSEPHPSTHYSKSFLHIIEESGKSTEFDFIVTFWHAPGVVARGKVDIRTT